MDEGRCSIQGKETRRRVLVLDPHKASCTATCYGLAARGHLCIHVDTVTKAVGAIVTFMPNVILYDSERWPSPTFPGLLGMMARVFSPKVDVITTSTHDESTRQDTVAHFVKPLNMDELDRLFR